MKVFWGLGKLLTLLFWLVVLVNLLTPFVNPLHLLANLAGGLLAGLHLLEAVFCFRSLRGRAHPWRDRLQILLFGVFHLQTLPAPTASKASHA
jgi:putative membrane protein